MNAKLKSSKKPNHANKHTSLVVTVIIGIISLGQLALLVVNSVNAIGVYRSLDNYRRLQEKQISKVIEMCSTSMANGISHNDDVTRRILVYYADRLGNDMPAKINMQYLKDFSLSYCRAAEFALYGVEDIDQRPFSTNDFLYVVSESPRTVTSESFNHIKW